MSKLVLHIPGGGTRDIRLDRDRVTLGRRADNDVCLPYPAVSADHAAVITVLEDSFLEDLQSTNGTLVNGKRITKHFLRDHDTIDIGRVQLVYCVSEDEVVAPLRAEAEATASALAGTSADASGEIVELSAEPLSNVAEDEEAAPVERLLAELLNSKGEAAVSVEIPPALTVVPLSESRADALRSEASAGVYLEVMNGPNTGQIAPMTKREFVLGRGGITIAVIRREDDAFMLVPVETHHATLRNGETVRSEGERLAFGDTIDVAGVRLRFGRRPPL